MQFFQLYFGPGVYSPWQIWIPGIFLGLKGRPALKGNSLTGVCEPIVEKMCKPWYHKPVSLHDLLHGWLNLLTLCSRYFVDVNFSRCLFIFAVCLEIRPNSRLTVNFCNRLIFYGERLLDPHPTSTLEPHSLSALSVAAYSIYWHLPSIAGGRLPHLQTEDAPCHGDKGPT
jgi:hypothetical protein